MDRQVPEAYRTAEVFRRTDAQTGVVVFNKAFETLFREFDKYWPSACSRSLLYDATYFPATSPLYSGVRIPGTQFAISTSQLLLRLNDKGQLVGRTAVHYLSLAELTQLVDALHKFVDEKRR